MNYSLPSSLFCQKHLGNPSPFSLFWVDVLVCLGALVSWHWGISLSGSWKSFLKIPLAWGYKKRILLLSCLFLSVQILPSAQGWTRVALPCLLFIWLSKGVFLSNFSYTTIRGLLASNVTEVLFWMCAYKPYSEPWDPIMMCLRVMKLLFECLWMYGPFLYLVVELDSQVALPWVRRGRWMSFGHLQKSFHMDMILHVYYFLVTRCCCHLVQDLFPKKLRCHLNYWNKCLWHSWCCFFIWVEREKSA